MAPRTRPIRLGIVEDDAELRMLLRKTFARDPDLQVVGEAGDGQGGLDLVLLAEMDVLLLDLDLPGMDGLDLLGELAGAARQPVVVVILSAIRNESLRRLALASGADAWIDKGHDPRGLPAAIAAAYDNARAAAAS